MKTIKIKDNYYQIIKKSSEKLGITPEEILDYLLSNEFNFAISQHKFNQWKKSKN